jgi:alpha-tubulin suppressor-like RCC1 family protein
MINTAEGVIRDGGIDPSNLGKGEWIYQMHHAVAQCNGNVPSVTDVPSLMIYLKNQGVRYIIVKAGTGADLFGVPGFNPQLTSSLVNSAHAAGLWIFGYNRSYATNTAGEIAIADYVFQQGADGFVWDAEAEWEYSRIQSQGPDLAIAQCSVVRAHWPNKFLAHSPFAYIGVHGSFPYKEFGYYCDAAMPQDYWAEFGSSPTDTVTRMSRDWRNWQNGLSGQWVNSIKPIVAVGQGYVGTGTPTAAQITEFVNALKTDPNPATAGGYKGVNYFVCEDHSPDLWGAIAANNIGNVLTNNPPVIANVSVASVNSSSATITWTTDQSSDSMVEYGVDTSYGTSVTNSTLIYYHTVALSGLSPYTTYHFRVKSKNSNNRQGVSGDYLLTTTAATVNDVIIESHTPGGTVTGNPPYSDSGFLDSSLKSTAAGLAGTGSRYATGGSGTPSCSFRPTLTVAGGNYDVFLTHGSASSISTDMIVAVGQSGCTGLPATTTVFQQSGANSWELVGRMTLNSGVRMPTLSFTYSSGSLSGSARMYSDAIKVVYVPPPPTGPSITTPPQSLTVTQGNNANFSVVAAGTPLLSYQWRFNGSNSIAGATGSVYTRNGAGPLDAGKYSVVITNAFGQTNSSDAVLTVLVPAEIGVSPTDVTTGLGLDATFTCAATGTLPLGYQWQFNGTNIAGATTGSLTVSNAQATNVGAYTVIVSNLYGTDSSLSAFLTLLDPYIASQPQSQSVSAGATASFVVSAVGTLPLSYQWLKEGLPLVDGGSISGTRSSSLTLSNVQSGNMGNYSVVVSNSQGWVASSNATLIGLFPPTLLSQPASQTVLAGAIVSFTVEAFGSGTFIYQWQRAGTNLAEGGKLTGTTTPSLTVSNVQASEMGNYSVVVSNAYGSGTSSNALLGLWPLAVWGRNDYNQANIPGALSNVVAIAGGLYHTLVTRADGTVVAWGAGTTNNGLSGQYGQVMAPGGLSNVVAVAGGYYHSLALGADGTVVAWGAGLTNTGASPLYGQSIVPNGLSNVMAIAAGGYHSLALKADRTAVAWGAGTNNTGSSPNYGQAMIPVELSNVVAIAGGGYHSLALKADGTVVAWGAGTSNTGASPHYGQAMVPNGLSNVVAIAGGAYHSLALKADGTVIAWGAGTNNTGTSPNYGQAMVPNGLSNVVAIAAGRYHSLALNTDGTTLGWGDNSYGVTGTLVGLAQGIGIAGSGYHNLVLEGDGHPYITVQPFSQTVAASMTVRLAAMAAGAQPLSCQWQRNGANMAGATSASLSLTNVQGLSAGGYSVVITNMLGSITSATAVLAVTGSAIAPQIDSIASLPDGRIELQVSGGPGNFAIESAPVLSGWTQLSSLTATGAVFQYIDPETNQASRFYRVRLLP